MAGGVNSMTDALETALSNLVLRGGSSGSFPYSLATRLWVALFTATPSDTGGGTEATYTGYARQSFRSGADVDGNQFTAPDGTGNATNVNVITFPANTGSSQTVTSWGIFNASTAGTMLFWGPLNASKSIDPSDVPSFPAGSFNILWD